MLSPFVPLQEHCDLCSKLKNAETDSSFLLDAGHDLYIYQSPFFSRWPGALMLVYKRHIHEQSEIRGANHLDTWQSLLAVEKAIKKVTHCKRINFVKFANAAEHLHWHIIPRYPNEVYLSKNSWELSHLPFENLYLNSNILFLEKDLPKLKSQINYELCNRLSPYFGSALFLRPLDENLQKKLLNLSFDEIEMLARKDPDNWQCLLMKRNYFNFAWDFIGGNCDANEFPSDGMIREVKEEVGWKISRYKEVTRQWKNGLIKGFVYLAIPENLSYLEENPEYKKNKEVQMIKYFSLKEIIESSLFSDSVKGRIKAFLENKKDFSSIDE